MVKHSKPKGGALLPVPLTGALHTIISSMSQSKVLRKNVGRPYLRVNRWIWKHLPASSTVWRPIRAYGLHLHSLIELRAVRRQHLGTFFFRNRPELCLLTRLLGQLRHGSTLDLLVIACSKGAEVYSFAYAVRCERPDLNLRLRALDIADDVLTFAARGVYSLRNSGYIKSTTTESAARADDVATNTSKDQVESIFDRMSLTEIEAMFDREGNLATVKPQFREGITWHIGDARDPELVTMFGSQDIVIANRFLCHMEPSDAESCLRNLGRLVTPGGHLFVSGVDLSVRSKVAGQLGWKPVTELIREIHEGDPSLRRDWPWEYWGLEPFNPARKDWETRYASVFQLL
jgi:chemotaxis methyl-accepting protein methylase